MHWPSIRAGRLSSHPGEFCKLFCSSTSREVDFFSESGSMRCPEQFLNMIDMCTVFSLGDERDCPAFCSLFNVSPDIVAKGHLPTALDSVRKAAVGARELRNKLAHDLLTLHPRDFDHLVECARQLLAGLHSAFSCVTEKGHFAHCFEQSDVSRDEIDGILTRHVTLFNLTDDERQVLYQQAQQLHAERERLVEENNLLKKKIGRNFDSFAACLKSEINMQLLAGMQMFAPFCILEFTLLLSIPGNQIGRAGGHGTVYQVVYYNQQLAVKVFEYEDPHAWRRELGSLTFLSHRNIVRIFYIVYDSINDQMMALRPTGYAMELMAHSAGDEIEWCLSQLFCVFEQVASALAFCHEHQIVHFDVKPENILLDESCTTAKLCDFGHAHKLRGISVSAVAGMQRGTLAYMAPELSHGEVDSSNSKLCDIYSFGKTMWKLLHPSEQITPFSSCLVSAPVPTALKVLVEQCTLQKPADRPQTMLEILNTLSDIRSRHQDDLPFAAESETSNPFPSDSLLAKCYQRFGGKKFDKKYFTNVKQEFQQLWCHRRLWVFELVLLLVLILLVSVRELTDTKFYVPLSVPCPVFNTSDMPAQYSMTSSGQNMSISVQDDVMLEPRAVLKFFDSNRLGLSSNPGMYRRDIVVLIWIRNQLAAVFEQNEETIYDCHGNLAYKTCYNCDKKLKIYSSDGNYIWSSSKPSMAVSARDDADSDAWIQVFGQPLDVPVAVVSYNYAVTVFNSSHAACNPILLTTIFSRAYFEQNYRNGWETFHNVCEVLFVIPLLALVAVSVIKLIQIGYVGVAHYFFDFVACCLHCLHQQRTRVSETNYIQFEMQDIA